jgi:hypothetical protein
MGRSNYLIISTQKKRILENQLVTKKNGGYTRHFFFFSFWEACLILPEGSRLRLSKGSKNIVLTICVANS